MENQSSPQSQGSPNHQISIEERYKNLAPLYERLAQSIVVALKLLLEEREIPVFSVFSRVKTLKSLQRKIIEGRYGNDPFQELTDICGVRIVCHHISDIPEIQGLVQSEFSVREEEDLSGRLKAKEFAYRSTHLIIGLKPGWLEAPNYSGLGNLVAEVQIRTMPMHAWAEIEHKLNYKTSIGLPEEAQRKLFRISALFEIADEELDSIRKASVENQNRLEASASKELLDLKMAKLDIDFLAVVMNSTYPDRPKSENYSPGLLKEILDAYLTTEDVINAVLVQQPLIEQIKKHLGESESTWTQTAALANALEIYSWTFYRKREKLLSGFSTWRNLVDFSRQLKINSDLSKNRTLP